MATSKLKKRAPERLFCNGCHKDTLHDLLKEVNDTIEDDVEIGGESYTVWEEHKPDVRVSRMQIRRAAAHVDIL
jgi:hypothetical protein